MTAFYNEHDEFAAQWLRNLIAAGHIAPGDVDERDLWDVRPDDLRGYSQVHFCAGIGIWSRALRQAGWSDARPVWTGSFPCQPFSAAGKRLGTADGRHLWPAGYHLISVCKPDTVLGEQVASPDGLGWLEGVQADMEAAGYAVGAVDTCAAGFADAQGNEGFHIRQRIYWGARRLGHSDHARPQGRLLGRDGSDQRVAGAPSVAGGVEYTNGAGLSAGHGNDTSTRHGTSPAPASEPRFGVEHSPSDGREQRGSEPRGRSTEPRRSDGRLADAENLGHERVGSARGRGFGPSHDGAASRLADSSQRTGQRSEPQPSVGSVPQGDGGSNAGVDWLWCRDGKYRPVESGTFPLAHEDPQRVGRLRAYGNALDASQAEGFVRAWMSCCP